MSSNTPQYDVVIVGAGVSGNTIAMQLGLAGKKVIDVGCGDGHVVKILSEAGADAAGIEPSRKAKAIGESQGLNIIEGYVKKGVIVDTLLIQMLSEALHAIDPHRFDETMYAMSLDPADITTVRFIDMRFAVIDPDRDARRPAPFTLIVKIGPRHEILEERLGP